MSKSAMSVLKVFSALVVLLSVVGACSPLTGLAQGKFPTGSYSHAEFTITFLEDGTHTVSAAGSVVVKGSYTVTQDQIILTDKEGEYACGATQPGKYKWTAVENGLKFEKLEDACDGRASAMAGQSWVRK